MDISRIPERDATIRTFQDVIMDAVRTLDPGQEFTRYQIQCLILSADKYERWHPSVTTQRVQQGLKWSAMRGDIERVEFRPGPRGYAKYRRTQ